MDRHTLAWPSETFLIWSHRVMPRFCRSCWNLMTLGDPERIYTTKATIGFKRNPKEFAWATNIRCYLLGRTLLLLSYTLIITTLLCLVKSGDLLSLFFLCSPLVDFFSFIVAQLHACVVYIDLPAGLAVVPTQGSYFVFVIFFCVIFRKQICFGSEGVARDKLVFEMLKHGHVSF